MKKKNTVAVLGPKAAADYIGVSLPTLYRWLNGENPELPQPVQLGPKRVGLIKSELDNFIATRQRGLRALPVQLRKAA